MSGVRIVIAPQQVLGWANGLRGVAGDLRDAGDALRPLAGLDLPPEAQAALQGIPRFAGPLDAESHGLSAVATAAGNLATGAERADAGPGATVTIFSRGLETARGVAGSLASGKLYVGKTLVTGEALKLMLSGLASMTGAPILKMLNGVTAWKSAATDALNKGWATAEIKATTPIAERLAIAALSRGKEEAVAGGRSVLGIAPGQAGDVGRWASRAIIPLGVASGIVNLGTDGPELLKQPSVDNFLGSLSGASGLVGSGAAVSSAIPLWGEGPSEVIAAGGYIVSGAADLLKTGYDLFKSSPPPAPLTLAQRLAATEAGQPYSTWAANGPFGTTPWALAHPFVQR